MRKLLTLIFLVSLASLVNGQDRYLKGMLQGSQEVPPNAATGSGVIVCKYNPTSKFIQLWGNYFGLSGAPTGAHIHMGASGVNGPIIITLTANGSGGVGTLQGSGVLSAGQETDLLAGNMYVNVHTSMFSGGELRAQLSTTTLSQTVHLNGRVQGAQEVPPTPSFGYGEVNALVDGATNEMFLTGSYNSLSANATAAHVHLGLPGTNGAIAVTLTINPGTFGTIHGFSTLSPTDALVVANGGSYVNVHNATYPGGEIRGQLTRLSQVSYFVGMLNGSQEVPPNPSTGKGLVLMKYDDRTKGIDLYGDFMGLSSPISAAHIHSGTPGVNGPIEVTLTHGTGLWGNLSAQTILTPAQESALLANNMYVNVHSSTYPGGELRGQLNKINSSEVQCSRANLQGSQEVPSNSSTGTGFAEVFYDKLTNNVYATGYFTGLGSNVTGAHIHQGPAGINGPIILPLDIAGTTSGVFCGSGTLSQIQGIDMIEGFTYINVHSTNIPAGELRGQLGNLVLPVKLKYFNGVRKGEKVELIWEISEEINLRNYQIEQQDMETGRWILKGSIEAGGFTNLHRYSYHDNPILGKGNMVNYRLKMVDKDGHYSYSPVIKINFRQNKAELIMLSNPVINQELKFMLTGIGENKSADITITDMNGRKMLQTTGKTMGNNNIDISQLAPGMYQLVIRINNEVLSKAFIK